MKLAIITFVIFLFCFSTISAQKLENSTLWKIEGNGLETPSYLFGTIHISCDATIESDVQKALDETSQVVLEIDMDDPEMQTKLMKKMFMTDDKSLQDFVSEDDYQAIDSLFIKNLGMSVKSMENVKPFFLTATFYPKLIDCPLESFEGELMKIAKAQGEEIHGLETLEDQLQVFEEIPYQDQIDDLVRMAKDNLAYDKITFAKMLDIYKEGNITKMLDLMNDDNYSNIAEHQDKLLTNRNIKWISKMGEYAKKQPTFFGVGAGHLAGEKGVINLLKKAGYSVSPILD